MSTSSQRPAISPELEAELRARRARLERRTYTAHARPIAGEVIVACRGAAKLGVPIQHAAEFRRAGLVALPGAPVAVAGLFQVRGVAHCCVDLLALLTGERVDTPSELVLIGMVQTPRGPLGLRFDEVIGPRTVYRDELDAGLQHACGPIVAMITRDLLEVIDIRRLCESPDICVTAAEP